uniref:Bromodomain and WD repeat-containing protein 1 n=1 Tax=Rhizophora mucronata TaxID=61149 RepID=A0A2P2J3F6_RHIMU
MKCEFLASHILHVPSSDDDKSW